MSIRHIRRVLRRILGMRTPTLVPADIDWTAYETAIATALAERDPGGAYVAVFEAQMQLFEAIHREHDIALCRLLALTCEAEHRGHDCARAGEPEPPLATQDDLEQAMATGESRTVLGEANGLWLHVWRCAIRRSDYDALARLASMWVTHARHYAPAQLTAAVPPVF